MASPPGLLSPTARTAPTLGGLRPPGKPGPGEPRGLLLNHAQLQPFDGVWKVTYLVVEKEVMPTAIGCACCAVVMTALSLAASQSAARAGGGPGGSGSGFGNVVCGQSYSPSCSVTAAHSRQRRAARRKARQPSGRRLGWGLRAQPVRVRAARLQPHPEHAGLSSRRCRWRAGRTAAGSAGAGRAPAAGAAQPGHPVFPGAGDLQLVHLPVWLWVNRAVWVARSTTAAVPGEQVTATAIPVSVTWRMGDGSVVVCRGPGTPYSRRYGPASASPDCGHTYGRSSAGLPRGAYRVAATITWDVTWQATGGAGGTLPPLFSTSAATFRVAESQTVNTAGGSR